MKPRHTLESVVDELAEGLGNGTIALSERDEEPEGASDPFKKLTVAESDVVAMHRDILLLEEPEVKHELLRDVQPPRQAQTGEQACIRKGLWIKGEITGTESLFIDGNVEGSINIPGGRVTVGKNGVVNANVSAREIVVLGEIKGNVNATERVDIRAEGALTGDVTAARISIEDNAFFKGGIDIRKPDTKLTEQSSAPVLIEAGMKAYLV
jgi:cytoskeletal protein CcmA (bactofilin family)